jgi:hypothetical protein
MIGKSCPVRIMSCRGCGLLVTKHGPSIHAEWCSDRCRQREYERRTHAVAIRYWTIAATPEALEVATIYFQLRQELRAHRRARKTGALHG